jgi:hypothetical protein
MPRNIVLDDEAVETLEQGGGLKADTVKGSSTSDTWRPMFLRQSPTLPLRFSCCLRRVVEGWKN